MNDMRELLERVGEGFEFPDHAFDRLIRRRERRIRNQRLAAALVAIIVSVIAIAALIRAFAGPPETGEHGITPSPSGGPTTRAVLVDIDTGEVGRLPATIESIPGAHQFHVSADGSMVTFSGLVGADPQIFVAGIDGTGLRALTSGTQASDPRLSPDASKIVYVGGTGPDQDLFVVDVTTAVSTRITHGLGDDRPAEPIPPTPSFSGDGETILYTAVDGDSLSLWTVAATGGASTRLLPDAAYGAYSPDGSLIAFHPTGPSVAPSVWPFDRGVSLAGADGKEIRLLESDGHIMAPTTWDETRPMWSPDSTRLVYEGAGSVRVLEPATGVAKDVMRSRGRWPSWFDDDTLIVENYEGALDPSPAGAVSTSGRLTLVDVDTGKTTPVPDSISSLPRSRDFSVSPDGARVAFLTEAANDLEHVHVYVADLDGTGFRRVTASSRGYAYLPRWSPDGTKIVYVGCCSDDVYLLSLESGRSMRLTHERATVWEATFSADGSSVLFTMAEGKKLSLWRVSTDGGEPTVLITNAAFGAYSPDGSTIAFRRNHPIVAYSSCPDCWWMGFGISFAAADGSEPQASSNTDGIFAPIASAPGGARWSPDGSRIVYRSDWNSFGELLVMDVATGLNERIGSGVAAQWIDNDTLLVDGFERP